MTTLIAASEQHYDAGQRELSVGHLASAKQEFNQAVDLLLQSPHGARMEPRLREHFDRLVDRISTLEVMALSAGDGFTEKRYESASIDELLAISTFDTPGAGLAGAVADDLMSTAHDLPIPLNSRVLSYIELFKGRLHDFLQEGLRRGSQYLPMIQQVFRAEGLPLDLAYVPLVESAFKPNALSRTKAKGVWQFMKGTGLENGLKHDWFVDERSDPEKATVAAAKYFKTLNDFFDGDWHLALASYNGGPGRLQRAIKRSGLNDFWALASRPKVLPRETRDYVPMILAAVVIAKNPLEYGFEAIERTPLAYDKVTLNQPVDLRHIAEWTGTSVDAIQSLNPELRRWTTPLRHQNYALKVPAGMGAVVEDKLVGAEGTELAPFTWYTARKGDTLLGISRKLKVSRQDLAEANYLSIRSRVAVGQKLLVPSKPAALFTATGDRPAPAAEPPAMVAESTTPADADQSSLSKLVYRVKRGDTLSAIARVHRTSISSLRSWNQLRSDRITAGDRLTIFVKRSAMASVASQD